MGGRHLGARGVPGHVHMHVPAHMHKILERIEIFQFYLKILNL